MFDIFIVTSEVQGLETSILHSMLFRAPEPAIINSFLDWSATISPTTSKSTKCDKVSKHVTGLSSQFPVLRLYIGLPHSTARFRFDLARV